MLPVVVYQRVADQCERAGVLDGDGEERRLSVDQQPVTVDPTLLDVGDVVVDDEAIYGVNQLEVADVRKQIRLHDGELHARSDAFSHTT